MPALEVEPRTLPGQARLVLSLRTTCQWWQLRKVPRYHRTTVFIFIFNVNIRVVESVIEWLTAENIHLALEMCKISCLLDL